MLMLVAFFWCSPGVASAADVFRVGSYNVENLFDLKHDGTEYPGYIPGGKYGWTPDMLAIKAENLARVLAGLNAQIVALQEVESMEALDHLRAALKKRGLDYPWAAITEKEGTAVRCALLSMYPIAESRDITVPGPANRSILMATIEINDKPLVIFVNHWRSRNAPESHRLVSAEALYKAISALSPATDYILVGDFNANYNEFEIIRGDKRANDTGGRTGINHVLKTVFEDRLVEPDMLLWKPGNRLHYNLWLELAEERRWSYLFFGRPRTLDNFLLPAALFDSQGFSYVKNSFDKFDPHYLFKDGRIFRWQREDRGRGRHLGKGYSDHLPIYACFARAGFELSNVDAPCYPEPVAASIADLYGSKTGVVRYTVEDARVVYKYKNNVVIKQADGRAIYVYGAAADLDPGVSYTIVVNRLNRFHGNLQVNGIESAVPKGGPADVRHYLLSDPATDFSDSRFENEVIGVRSGRYEGGRFYYLPDRSIKLFFRDKALAPDRNGQVVIQNARIGFHGVPQIVIERKSQIHPLHESLSWGYNQPQALSGKFYHLQAPVQ